MGSSNKKGISFAINKDEFTTHSDLKDQPKFQERVAEILKQRKERRRRERGTQGPQLPGFVKKEEYNIQERKMTASEIKREAKLKKKYDDSKMKASMIAKYGPEKGKQIYFATIRKQAMKEELELDEAKISRTEIMRIKTHLAKPNKEGEVMTRSYQATKEDFELWIQDILSEGYDLSEYSVEDLYDIYEEIISDENVITIPYESPYKNINESLEEEVELSPYEYWREFISESEDDNDDEEGDDYEDDYIEEEIELTPYELWKLYSIQKNIQEQGQDEDEEDDGRSGLNPASEAKMKLNAHLKRQKRAKLAAHLKTAADELENS